MKLYFLKSVLLVFCVWTFVFYVSVSVDASLHSVSDLALKSDRKNWRSSPPPDLQPEGVTFPFREVWLTEPSPSVYIFVESDSGDLLKIAKERRRTLLRQKWNCRLFLKKSFSDEDLSLLKVRMEEARINSRDSMKRGAPMIVLDPVSNKPKLAVLFSPTAESGKTDSEIRFETKMLKLADRLYRAGIDVFLTSHDYISPDVKDLWKMKVYLGDGDFASLIAGKFYYAYLFGDLMVESDSVLRRGIEPSDLRKLEKARLHFIQMRSKVKDSAMLEDEFKELISRLRVLKRRSYQGKKCSLCKEISSNECAECLRFVTDDYFSDLEELARDSFQAEIWLEDRISRSIRESGQSVASFAMAVSTQDLKVPSYAYTLNLASSAKIPKNNFSIFFKGPRCDELSFADLVLSSKLSNGLLVNFPNITLQKNFDDICGAIHTMKTLAAKRKDESLKINVQDCAGALILEFGRQFDWEKDGVITPVVESFLLSLCSSIIGNSRVGDPDKLLYAISYSPSGLVMSPTSGEIDVNIAMERIEAEERVISAASFGKPCRISDLTYAGWVYDEESKIWIRNFDGSNAIPVAVRYIPIENGNLLPIGLENDEKNSYFAGESIFLDKPAISKYWSKNMFVSSGDIDKFARYGAQFKASKLEELKKALIMQDKAAEEAREKFETAYVAREKYEKAIAEEERLLELAKIAADQKEKCRTRASIAKKEAEIAELQKQLYDNLKVRTDLEAESAKKLHEAALAEARRREAAEKSKVIANELLESAKNLVKLNRKLKEKLVALNKHRSAYDATVLAESRILKDIAAANELLDSSVESELMARKIYDENWSGLENMEKEIKLKLQDIADLREKIKGSFSLKSKELQDIFESHRTQKEELEVLAEKHMAKRDSLESEINALLSLIEQHRKKGDEFRNDFDMLNSEINLLSRNIETTMNSISKGEIDLNCMQKNADDLKKELELIFEAQRDLMELIQKNKELKAELLSKLKLKEQERDEILRNIQAIEAELSELKKKLAMLGESIQILKLELDKVLSQITTITEMLAKLEIQKEELDKNSPDLLKLEAEERRLLEQLERLNNKRAEEEENLKALLEKHSSLKNKISGKLAAKQLALQVAQKAVNELKLANVQVDKELSFAKKEYANHLRHTGSLLSKHNNQKKELCILIDEEKSIADELSEKVNEARKHDVIIQEIRAKVAAFNDVGV